jgi:hypothetical protein
VLALHQDQGQKPATASISATANEIWGVLLGTDSLLPLDGRVVIRTAKAADSNTGRGRGQ